MKRSEHSGAWRTTPPPVQVHTGRQPAGDTATYTQEGGTQATHMLGTPFPFHPLPLSRITYLLTFKELLTYVILCQNSAFAMSVVRLRRPRVWNGV